MAFDTLCSRWTLVKKFEWTTLRESGDDLAMIPVTPSYSQTDSNRVFLTTAGFLALPFTYWRCDMEYKIVIPVSSTHRGMMQIYWTPIGSVGTGDVTNVSYNTIVDITAGTEHTVSVGYAREDPFLQNRLMNDNMAILPQGAANGFLQFRVVNPLYSTSPTADVNVFIFARAKNLEVAVPQDNVLFGTDTIIPYTFQCEVTLQGKASGAIGDGAIVEEVTDLVPSPGEYPSDQILFGEKVRSCRELLQKPSKMVSSIYNGDLAVTSPYPLPGSTVTNNLVTVWTWQGHYRSLFYGMAFSERWKALVHEPCWVGAAKGRMETSASSAVPTMSPLTYTGPGQGSEFRVPYYYPKKFKRTFISQGLTSGVDTTVLTTRGDIASSVIWYYSFGPDIRATCFRQVPVVKFSTSHPGGWKVFWT